MAEARREKLLQMIRSRGYISLKELEHAFPEVSTMTLRRDLQLLDDRGLAIRVRKGARSVQALPKEEIEPVYDMRAIVNLEAKERVAAAAVRLLEPGRSLFLDAGTTVMRLARALPDENFSIITYAPNVGLEVAKRRKPSVFLLGGRLLKENLTLVGGMASSMLDTFNIDTAVMSCSGFTMESGFTCGNHDECELKQKVIAKARRVIMLMDGAKIGKSLPLTFAQAGQVSELVTDSDDAALRDHMAKHSCMVIQA